MVNNRGIFSTPIQNLTFEKTWKTARNSKSKKKEEDSRIYAFHFYLKLFPRNWILFFNLFINVRYLSIFADGHNLINYIVWKTFSWGKNCFGFLKYLPGYILANKRLMRMEMGPLIDCRLAEYPEWLFSKNDFHNKN